MSYKFDHRQLADEMEIFVFDEQIGAGLPLWLPNGVAIRDALENFMKHHERIGGYQRVVSPHVSKGNLFEKSGHIRAYGNNMFPPMKRPDEDANYYLRPMNCPQHHCVFSARPRSYRDLPLRIAEYGQVYRYESSGALRGLVRARGLCQNDAHIYVSAHEALDEICQVLALHEHCYRVLGLSGYRYRLSKHDSENMASYDGSKEDWMKYESLLRQALVKMSLPFFEAEGEAAFYGPKIDVQMKVGPHEEESVASVQLDFNSAEKFELKYVSPAGEYEMPLIIHRAPLGSHERFVALLLEYYDGHLPGWLAPVQVQILPIGERGEAAAHSLADGLIRQNIRVQVDRSSGSLSKRLLFSHKLRPFIRIVLGEKDLSKREVSLQMREKKIVCSIEELSAKIQSMIQAPL